MASPLVATKLYAPRPGRSRVERLRLTGRLERGAESRLTLISAPAGFGKTTLLADWLAASTGPAVAWLSLDQTDNDPASFWPHVVAALGTAVPGFGETLLPVLQAGPPTEAQLALLLNALSALPQSIDLVLDDYHVIDRPEIESAMAFVLDHLPPQVHLVISTRADPALPLARLRARGELTEVRSADLRFTAEEAAAYLNGAMGLGLSAADVAALERRTEGWIAALQLAALSMEGRDDPTGFIAGFAGNDRYIVDYLVEEVLQRQPDEVRRFLLETCFLSRLSGPLCDAVTGATGSKAMLDALDRANLFLVPLDPRREWYRYHHLFADVLLTHLADDASFDLPALHRRASDWYEANGERPEAIRHALAAGDVERAAELIELAIAEMRRTRGEALLRTWIRALPDDLVRRRPVLGLGFVGALVSIGDFDDIESRLHDAEQRLADPDVIATDRNELPRMPSAIALYRAVMAQVRGDVPGTIAEAQRSLDLALLDDHLGRAAPAGFLGIAHWARGNLDAAYRSWTACGEGLRRAGHVADVLGTTIARADINLARGRLNDAIRVYEDALTLAAGQGGYPIRGSADLHAGLSELHLERNDLERARTHLQKSEELGQLAGLPQHPHRWRIAAARLQQAEGDTDAALALLDDAQRRYVSDFFPNVRPIAAMTARVHIAEGRLSDAERWQRDAGVTIDDELTYLREYEHITLARLLLAQEVDATAFLDRLHDSAERGGRIGSLIEILLLQRSAAALDRALTLAEPEGYVRLFLDEGEPMAALLRAALKRGTAPGYTRTLLAAFGKPEERAVADHPDLIEPLSDREIDVLRLLRSDLDGPDIARELRVSLNTMRTHTKNIYEKLGVSSRRAAVRRADELNLFQRG